MPPLPPSSSMSPPLCNRSGIWFGHRVSMAPTPPVRPMLGISFYGAALRALLGPYAFIRLSRGLPETQARGA